MEPRTLFSAAISFAAGVSFAAGTAPVAIATADFNGDGHADLAVADATAETVNVFYGTGNGTFTAGPVLALTAPPTAILTADLNDDGHPDLVVAASAGNANPGPSITTFLNGGTGTFALGQRTTIVNGGGTNDPVAIAVGDFNGDGDADVVATEYSDAAVAVLLGTGTGTFAAPVPYNVGSDPTAVAVGKFYGTSYDDVAVAATLTAATGTASGADTPGLLVLQGSGDGQFSAGTVDALTGDGAATLAAGDLVGDGKGVDLAVGNADPSVSLLVNSGSATFNTTASPATAAGSAAVAIADFNLDGVPDVVSADGGTAFSSGADSVTVVPGAGTGTVAASTALTVGSLPTGLVVADFNGDGRPDIATADEGGGTVTVLLNTVAVTQLVTKTTLAASAATVDAGAPSRSRPP